MMANLKLVALHFEPIGQLTTHFVDSNGKLFVEPHWELEVSGQQADRLTNAVAGFPSELSYDWMCAPIFRDVLVWKEETGRIIRVFQCCFECDQYWLSDSTGKCVLVNDVEKNPFAELIDVFKEAFAGFDKETNYVRSDSFGRERSSGDRQNKGIE